MRLTNLARIGTGVAGWTHAFACKFSGDNSEGQTIYARRITFEDIRVEGGNSAIEVAGYLNGTTAKLNTGVVDDVTVDGWYHDTGVVPTAFKTSQHVLVGGSAIGGRCRIANGYGFNSGDLGVEYDSMQSVEIDNVFIQDSWTAGFFGASLNDPTSPKTQLWTHVRVSCHGATDRIESARVRVRREDARRTARQLCVGNERIHAYGWHEHTTTCDQLAGGTTGRRSIDT
jgi:hypothetical protein